MRTTLQEPCWHFQSMSTVDGRRIYRFGLLLVTIARRWSHLITVSTRGDQSAERRTSLGDLPRQRDNQIGRNPAVTVALFGKDGSVRGGFERGDTGPALGLFGLPTRLACVRYFHATN